MARLPNGCIRMLCALLQFGSEVSAVNSPSPPTARTRRNGPRTALSKRFSSLSSSTRSWPDTITIGEPIMSSQKIGPNSLASRARFCTGALESSDSMLPTTGFVGGCGIGANRLLDAIAKVSPDSPAVIPRERALARVSKDGRIHCLSSSRLAEDGSHLRMTLTKSLSTPFDQLGADLFRLFLLRPMAAVAHQVFLQVRHELFHAVGRGRRQHGVVLGHDHQ